MIPTHLKANPGRLFVLRRFAQDVAGHFGRPVYLCGSALRDDNADPRDWDIRCIIPDADFAVRYGDVLQWEIEGGSGMWTRIRHRWSADCVKWRRRAVVFAKINIDFQIMPASHARRHYRDKPKVRLDRRPRR